MMQIPAVVMAAETIEVVTEIWEPYSYLLPDGSVGGTSTAKIRRILDKTGLKYTIKVYPWARAYRTALNKKNVLIYSIYRTKKREEKFQWLCPFLPVEPVHAYALQTRRDIRINTLDELKLYLTAIPREDYVYQYLIEQGFKEYKHLDITPTYDISLHKLVKQRIDLIIGAGPSINKRLKSLGYKRVKLTPVYKFDPRMVAGNCMAFNLATPPGIVEKVRKALLQVNQAIENKAFSK